MHIRLNMIVKNESAVIRDALASVKPFIHSWCIVDTGSTDDTRDIIWDVMSDMPGELLSHPWKNFGFNRTAALDAAVTQGPCDWLLCIDAKDKLTSFPKDIPDGYDGFYCNILFNSIEYQQLRLLKPDVRWHWNQPVHAAPCFRGQPRLGRIRDLEIVPNYGKHGSAADPAKYQKQADLLRQQLQANPNDPRLTYYYAQALKDAGELKDALAHYRVRASMNDTWREEAWSAAYEAAKLGERLKLPFGEVLQGYLRAYELRPSRAEPLNQAARICRFNGLHHSALLLAQRAVTIPYPNSDLMFVEFGTYESEVKEELGLALFATTNDKRGALKVYESIDIANLRDPAAKMRVARSLKFFSS